MPVSSSATVIPTVEEFISHWEEAHEALGPTAPIIVAVPDKGAFSLLDLTNQRQQILDVQTLVQARINDVETQRAEIVIQKTALLKAMDGFLSILDGYYQGTKFYGGRPLKPSVGEGQDRFSKPMADVMTLWEDINTSPAPPGLTLPVELTDGETQGSFASRVSALQFAYLELTRRERRLKTLRTERALKEDLACAVMKAYRIVAPQKLEEHPALASTLPRLSPEPGHTPDPVAASGSHIPPSTTHITHAASTDPDIEYYVLEGLIGEEWNEDDAVHLGRHNAGEPNEFTITFGLAQPGSAVVYKVYAVLDTGRRAGSEAIVVRRV